MKMQSRDPSAGLNKKSFAMFFGGGEIWFEHLDSIYDRTELAISKFSGDYNELNHPSKPSLMALNIAETEVNDLLVSAVAQKLLNGGKLLTRVVVVGADRKGGRKFAKALAGAPFALRFINDFEKAKEWLVTEEQ